MVSLTTLMTGLTERALRASVATLMLSLIHAGGLHAQGDELDATIRSEYPRILTSWAVGDDEGAIESLAALETGLVRPKKVDRDIEAMWRSKLAVIRDTISRGGTEVLVPIMLLHHDASRYYASRGAVRLARHSGMMSAELAEYYAESSATPGSGRLAADLLASLAGHLQQGLVVRQSAKLYYRALRIDGANLAAHMGLASMFERRGELAPALEHYEKAARLAPGRPEPLLRHAMVAARLDDIGIAMEDLDRVLTMEAPDWMRRVALQEKAKCSSGEAAAEVARAALEEYPDSSRQAIQRAYLLERQRRPGEALAVLNGIAESAEQESERYFYTRWPDTALEESRARLRRDAREHSEVLETAVAAALAVGAVEAKGG